MTVKNILSYILKIPAGMLSFFLGLMLGGTILPMLGLGTPAIPEGVDTITVGMISLAMSIFIVIGGFIVAHHLTGNVWSRWLSLSGLIFVAYGVNNALEGALFTTIEALASPQNMLSVIVLQLFPSLLCGLTISALERPRGISQRFTKSLSALIDHYPRIPFSIRGLASILGFVVIYYGIGVIISPLVTPIYLAGDFELVLPSIDQILLLQVIRGTLVFATVLPIIIAWRGTRNQFIFSVGTMLTILLGLFPLSLAYWIALHIRAIHIIEILVDSFLYAGLVGYLFSAKISSSKDNQETPGAQ